MPEMSSVLFDQQVELFELRLHGFDVSEVEIHYFDQERRFSVCVSRLPYLSTRHLYASYPFCSGTSRTIFLGPFVVSSAKIL